jgi:hypothetical protein
VERIFPFESTGSGHGENPLGEAFSVLGLVAKTELPPLDRRSETAFRHIIGGFYTLMTEEGKQVRPIAKRALCSGGHLPIRAARKFEAILFHASPRQNGSVQKLPAAYIAF